MTETLHCICLRVTRHTDKLSLVTLWSRERGRVTAAISAGGSAGARRQRALMMPMGLVEGVADIRGGSDVVRLRDVRPYLCGNPAAGDPARTVSALFVCDFLGAVLWQAEPDPTLTDFIFASAQWMAKARSLANYHLVFLYRIGHFLGIQPDMSEYRRGALFDMRDGLFRTAMPNHRDVLCADDTRLLYILSRIDYADMHRLRLARSVRNAMLDGILRYYTMHLGPLTLPSLDVVRSVCD